MADPFAPPADRSARPQPAPGQAYRPTAAAAAPPALEEAAPRAPPAHPGVFWVLAAVGVGAVCVGRLLSFFVNVDDLPTEDIFPVFLAEAGAILLALGLALAAVLQRGLAVPWRIALLLGGGYFAVMGGWAGLLARFP